MYASSCEPIADREDIKGAALNIAFSSLGIFISLGLSAYYRMTNRSRDRKEHGQVAKPGEEEIRTYFDKASGFRCTSSICACALTLADTP